MLGIDTEAINNLVARATGVVTAIDITEVKGAIVQLNSAAANLDAAALNIRLITDKLAQAFGVSQERT